MRGVRKEFARRSQSRGIPIKSHVCASCDRIFYGRDMRACDDTVSETGVSRQISEVKANLSLSFNANGLVRNSKLFATDRRDYLESAFTGALRRIRG